MLDVWELNVGADLDFLLAPLASSVNDVDRRTEAMTLEGTVQAEHLLKLYRCLPPGGVARAFPDEAACELRLQAVVWPDGPKCPLCQTHDVRSLPKGRKFWCASCRKQFSVKSLTIFRKSKVPLRSWFLAVELFLRAHERGRIKILLTEERFAQEVLVARMTARRMLFLLRVELAKENGGEFGLLLCSHSSPIDTESLCT